MLAYKFLDGARSRFTGFAWPLPGTERAGAWVDVPGPLQLCVNGVHACRPAQLPPWLGPDLWRIELAGDVVDAGVATIASRARLVARVDGWDGAARRAFAADCADRARDRAGDRPELAPLAAAVERFAVAGEAAAAGYWTAVVTGRQAAGSPAGGRYDAAFAAERAQQARRLAADLRLPE